MFQNNIDIKTLELYNKREKLEKDLTSEVIAYKFRLLRPLGKLYNTTLITKFKELVERLVPLDNHTK